MKLNWPVLGAFMILTQTSPCTHGQSSSENPANTQVASDPYFGDYGGTYSASELKVDQGGPAPVAAEAKVVAEGNGSYRVVLVAAPPATPGVPLQIELPGRVEGERVVVAGPAGGHDWEGEIAGRALRVSKHSYGGRFDMKQIVKKSPTLGLKPPKDAIVLLAAEPGQKPSLDEWRGPSWVVAEDGILHKNLGNGPRGDLRTKREFRNVQLHVEFRIPYEPEKREQGRGNSGVIFTDRYEVQVLDSYGLIAGTGDCGAIYGVAPPRVNATFPPLFWQTYDITFHAAKMDGTKPVRGPQFTVMLNGVKVQDNQTCLTPTGDPKRANAQAGPIRLQDHGNLVYFRNIWVEELPDTRD